MSIGRGQGRSQRERRGPGEGGVAGAGRRAWGEETQEVQVLRMQVLQVLQVQEQSKQGESQFSPAKAVRRTQPKEGRWEDRT